MRTNHIRMCLWGLGFDSMIQFIYSGDQKIITTIQDLDQLFEIYHIADKVGNFLEWIKNSLFVKVFGAAHLLHFRLRTNSNSGSCSYYYSYSSYSSWFSS